MVNHNQTLGERWQVVRSGHGKLRMKGPLNGHLGVVPRLKSRKSLIKCTEPINTTAKAARMELWRERLNPPDASVHLDISVDEHLPAGTENPWTTWKSLNKPVAYTCWPVKSEHVKVGIFKRSRNMWLWHHADHVTFTGLPHDEDCVLWQRLPASLSAVSGIGRARFDGRSSSGGRTRMMMTITRNLH